MTLHAQRSLAAQSRVVLVIRPFGRVTTAAGHHLPGARIEHALSRGMTEGGVMSMTFAAHGIDLTLEHGRMVGAVRGMAVVAGLGFLVLVGGLLTAFEGRFMTGAADVALLALEQARVITGMGRMAGDAAVLLITHQMIMRRGHLITDIRMATQAVVDQHRLVAGMAVVASGGKRIVQHVADQSFAVAAVRAVARAAVARLGRKAGVLLAYRRCAVAAQTQSVASAHQQVGIFRLVWLVAGRTLAPAIRRVSILELLWQIGVTTETGVCRALIEQALIVRCMGIMTSQALALLHRLVNETAILRGLRISMAGIAQILDRLLQQPLVPGNVRTVARQAVSPGHRVMIDFFLEGAAVVAVEAVRDGQSRPLRRQNQQQGRSHNHNGSHNIHLDHQFVPPS